MLCGGTKQTEDATVEVQGICEKVKPMVEAKTKCQYAEFTAHSMRTQVVAGTNYFVKVHLGNEKYIHLRIYQNLKQELELSDVQADKLKADEIEYF